MVSLEYVVEFEFVFEIDFEIEFVGFGVFILMGKYFVLFLVC